MTKRLLVIALAVLVLMGFFVSVSLDSQVKAQNTNAGDLIGAGAAAAAAASAFTAAPEIRQLNEGKISKDVNQEKYNASVLRNTAAEISCGLMGTTYGCVELDDDGNVVASKGLTQSLATLTTSMYTNPPANTQAYIADILNSSGIATPAYAQGLGFASLSPILDAWKIFRNLAYFFFVIIFLFIGIMIILRRKVGQAAITAQQAIPQIIIALLAVTFSYAIAGLLIDLMYVFMFLLVAVSGESSQLIDKNFIQLGAYLLTEGLGSVSAIGQFVESSLSSTTGLIADAVEILAEITVALIIAIAVTVGVFKLFFELLKTYVTIIISVTLSPLLLMFGAIPGRGNFLSWVRSLVGNLAAFPTVLMIMIIFQKLVSTTGATETGFLPPYLFGSGSAGAIPALVGLGLILALPEAVQKMKQALGASDGPFGEILKAGFDRAKAQYGRAASIRNKAALAGAGAVAGGAAGYYFSRDPKTGKRPKGLRNAAIGAGLGLAAPAAIPVGKFAFRGVNRAAAGVERYGKLGLGLLNNYDLIASTYGSVRGRQNQQNQQQQQQQNVPPQQQPAGQNLRSAQAQFQQRRAAAKAPINKP